MLTLETIRIALILAMMCYASYSDLRFREVSDKLWLIFGIIGAIITTYDFVTAGLSDYTFLGLISIGVSAAVSFGLYYAKLYGGADAKALTVISVIMPIYWPVAAIHPFTAIYTFMNGLLISAALPIGFAVYNFIRVLKGDNIFEGLEHEPIWRKILACFLGTLFYDVKAKKFWMPMEIVSEGRRRFTFSIIVDVESQVDGDRAWLTPGIPLLVFITSGFVVSVFYGDLLGLMFRRLFSI
ncbi:MAG: prepilin peptidase [Nitrososphaerota archaeon]|nr:prepilin peptidase [Aigarchaeota archaeon]MDW8076796.1 prepilin peptidase [Nitrososphaerota archaeon]